MYILKRRYLTFSAYGHRALQPEGNTQRLVCTMKNLFSLLLCASLLTSASGQVNASYSASYDPPVTKTLRLKVSNVDESTGMIWVGIYTGEDNFLIKEKARLVGVNVDREGDVYIDLEDMEVGKAYSLAIFHDIDNDGEMNRNWLGLPSEPWAFSGPAITRLRLPTFDETKFTVSKEMMQTTLRLRMI